MIWIYYVSETIFADDVMRKANEKIHRSPTGRNVRSASLTLRAP